VRVDIKRLFESFGRIAWKHGMVSPSRLRHVVEPDGAHRIELRLEASEVVYQAATNARPASWGATTPATPTSGGATGQGATEAPPATRKPGST
jgi:hypothetical protein